jgi:hypothetical protein
LDTNWPKAQGITSEDNAHTKATQIEQLFISDNINHNALFGECILRIQPSPKGE